MRALILGGTFNPVHVGHIRLGIEASEVLDCERLVWLPGFAPHYRNRQNLLSFETRLDLLDAACRSFRCAEASDLESRHDGDAYSFDVIPALCAEKAIDDPHFALGIEQFSHLDCWHHGLRLPYRTNIAVAQREGLGEDLFHRTVRTNWSEFVAAEPPEGGLASYRNPEGRRITLLAMPRIDVSSSLIRKLWREGRNIAQLVPDRVLSILLDRKSEVDHAWHQEADEAGLKKHHHHLQH